MGYIIGSIYKTTAKIRLLPKENWSNSFYVFPNTLLTLIDAGIVISNNAFFYYSFFVDGKILIFAQNSSFSNDFCKCFELVDSDV